MQEAEPLLNRITNSATTAFAIKAGRMLADAYNLCCFGITIFLGTKPVRKNQIIKRDMLPNGDTAASSSHTIDGKTTHYFIWRSLAFIQPFSWYPQSSDKES
jgi:hypothetical protein